MVGGDRDVWCSTARGLQVRRARVRRSRDGLVVVMVVMVESAEERRKGETRGRERGPSVRQKAWWTGGWRIGLVVDWIGGGRGLLV